MKKNQGNIEQLHELLYQALETELGGEDIYKTAIACAVNKDLKEEWQSYLEETLTHQRVLAGVFEQLNLDPTTQTSGRKVVNHLGVSLVKAMEMAQAAGDPQAAELVASECVVLAETKDHSNWELIGTFAKHTADTKIANVLQQAYDAVATDEAHHLFHTQGWSRELWIQSLGLPAVLPPPEELKEVESAIGASRAEQQREKML